jgi:hypothetical protein
VTYHVVFTANGGFLVTLNPLEFGWFASCARQWLSMLQLVCRWARLGFRSLRMQVLDKACQYLDTAQSQSCLDWDGRIKRKRCASSPSG